MIANGPLALAAVVLNNALVLHDLNNLASCFIHLTPAALAWCLRWYSDEYEKTFPKVFGLPGVKDADPTFMELVIPASSIYTLWWAAYLKWMLVFGRHLGHPQHRWDTIYFETMRNNKAASKLVGYN